VELRIPAQTWLGPALRRRVSSRGGLMVARQEIHAGMVYAGKTATVICESNHFQVVIDGETHRYKANTTDKHLLTRPAET
jgi:hypothetical protein